MRPYSDRIQFEVRLASPDTLLEQVRRGALRATLNGEYERAGSLIELMLKMHPRSYGAYLLRGGLTQFMKNPTLARASFQQALQILQADADEQLNQTHRAPLNREREIEALSSKIRMMPSGRVARA